MFAKLLGRSRGGNEATLDLYTAIVAQARQPDFYRRLAIPDSVDGRFEMIVLHSVILFHRLQRDGEAGRALAQKVFDLFVTDMDRSLREMGVGDLGVPKRMKAIGKSFYGRLEAYGKPVAEGDRAALSEALQRNVFPDDEPAPLKTEDLAAYAIAAAATLDGQSFDAIAAGKLVFPGPSAVLDSEALA